VAVFVEDGDGVGVRVDAGVTVLVVVGVSVFDGDGVAVAVRDMVAVEVGVLEGIIDHVIETVGVSVLVSAGGGFPPPGGAVGPSFFLQEKNVRKNAHTVTTKRVLLMGTDSRWMFLF